MQSTLFFIPAELAGFPIFGVGWLLVAWILLSLAIVAYAARQQGWNRDTLSYIPYLAIVGLVIVFLLPNLVTAGPDGKPGIPVRGFGVMMMLATIAGVGLAAYRAWQVGIDPEVIYSLAFCMFIAGIVGARAFYIVQKLIEGKLEIPLTDSGMIDLKATLVMLASVTQGGLVVYGSVIAGVPAGIWYLRRRGLPILPIADIIAPSMALGQAIGRIGCFLNGCCYGGVCLTASYAMTFPPESGPYLDQSASGWRSGVWLMQDNGTGAVRVGYVAPGSDAERQGMKAGAAVKRIDGVIVNSSADAQKLLAAGSTHEIETTGGTLIRWTVSQPPARSVPVHPTQLYAAIDAGLLALLLWAYFPYRRRDGEVFALLVTLHPISRFVLEAIRDDEDRLFGPGLTISQLLSLAILALACVLWWYVERQPRLASE
ncbi:MAG: prolipoprotein diacylglyceryl transferase [Planctomycetaceae bacterium]|nr:prolipoprotein diacylglyceryl transferase [Planctomycetaceae bacterium]